MLDQLHADLSRSKRERRYNAATMKLDDAIRHLNQATNDHARGDNTSANWNRNQAGFLLQTIGPELLIIDPEAIL